MTISTRVATLMLVGIALSMVARTGVVCAPLDNLAPAIELPLPDNQVIFSLLLSVIATSFATTHPGAKLDCVTFTHSDFFFSPQQYPSYVTQGYLHHPAMPHYGQGDPKRHEPRSGSLPGIQSIQLYVTPSPLPILLQGVHFNAPVVGYFYTAYALLFC